MNPAPNLDALLPPDMARKAEGIGVKKAELDLVQTCLLAVLAGAFIALGAVFSTTVATGAAEHLGYGPSRLLVGLSFSLGLILVVIAGAELFTGNNLIVMAWASGRLAGRAVLRNWSLVFTGNFVGATATGALVVGAGQYQNAGGRVGEVALQLAAAKLEHSFVEAFCLGVLCNALVCLAVWLTLSCRTVADRVLAVIFPITAFVAAGFEHCVANMYFLPTAIWIRDYAPSSFWSEIDSSPAVYSDLSWANFLTQNLLPVTAGNLVGGALLVGAVYWLAYSRKP